MKAKKFIIITLVVFWAENYFSKNDRFYHSQKFYENYACLYNSNAWYILLFLEVRKNEKKLKKYK